MEIAKIHELDPREYEHPLDTKALNNLQRTAGLDTLIRKFYEKGFEKAFKIGFMGSYLRVNARNFPELNRLLEETCEILYLPSKPQIYIGRYEVLEALVLGVDAPIIFLSTETLSKFSAPELRFMLGKAIGHIKSSHVLYQEVAMVLPEISSSLADATLGISSFFTLALQVALIKWQRMCIYTADRAGLLACQDITTAMGVLMKVAGLPEHFDHDVLLDDFITQAREYQAMNENLTTRVLKATATTMNEHPFAIDRANQLLKWVDEEAYVKVLQRETRMVHEIAAPTNKKFCSSCGFPLKKPVAFCPECGYKLT